MHILIIDNYDSFVFNIAQLVRESPFKAQCTVKRCDSVLERDFAVCSGLILSPGPGLPLEAEGLMDIIRLYSRRLPMLGICLGMQAIAQYSGCELRRLEKPLHGHKSHLNILMPDNPLMYGMAQGTTIGRYHSWVVEPAGISPEIAVTATDEQGNIMAISHRKLPLFGVQFHPESVISACGPRIISNFLNLCNKNGRP